MTLVTGIPFCGDQPKANVSLRLTGLTDGKYYVLGERIEGELTVTPERDMDLARVTFQLEFIIKGVGETATIEAKTIHLPVSKILRKGGTHKFPVQIPYRFSRPSHQGEHLNSYWQLKVFLDYDPAQYGQSFVERVLKVTAVEQRHGTSFDVLVRYGKGAYQASPRELPIGFVDVIPLPSKTTLSWCLGPLFFFCFLAVDGRIKLEDAHAVLLLLLVMAIVWVIIRLSVFQMTPMELRPLQDGQLRLRILDRGKDQLKNAIVGYRLQECYMAINEGNETPKKAKQIQKDFPLAEVGYRKEYFYEAVLPWPEIDLPVTVISGNVGYEWEVFIQLPNPLTGGTHEKSWPIDVGWEQFRLAPPTVQELEQEELEVLKLKELERVPKPEGRQVS